MLQSSFGMWQLSFQNAEVLGVFLDCWIDKIENLIQAERKKLSALALISLLSSNLG